MLRVVALSGGYSREEANERLARNHGVVASFSRALTEGLTAQQTDEEFDAALDTSIGGIFGRVEHLIRSGPTPRRHARSCTCPTPWTDQQLISGWMFPPASRKCAITSASGPAARRTWL